jgi:hypothetical protein
MKIEMVDSGSNVCIASLHITPVCRIKVDILEIYMNIEMVRKIAGREEIDYQFLLSVLSNYASPREKITECLKSGVLNFMKKLHFMAAQR